MPFWARPYKAALAALGFHIKAEHGIVIPNYLVMSSDRRARSSRS